MAEADLAAEERRFLELLKKNDDVSTLPTESIGARVVRFAFAVISLSIWPFYLILFVLVGFGGQEIAKANKEAAEAAQKTATVAPVSPYSLPGNMPIRPPNSSMPFNPTTQRFTPPPFPNPPRFPMPNRPPVTPPKASTPASSPASSPAPAVKGL